MGEQINRLELNWIDKYKEVKLEPRILIENDKNNYGKMNTENMLIHGDNLLALKTLEGKYTNKFKCIYIDPPFNTGNAFEHYDDCIEHSIWLSLMKERFILLRELLANDGAIVVHLNNDEMAYCKVLMDEVFGRGNYLNTITMTTNDPSGFKATGNKIFSTANYLLIYAKNKPLVKINKVYKSKEYDSAYSKIFLNMDGNYKNWEWMNFSDFIAKKQGYNNSRDARTKLGKKVFESILNEESIKYSEHIFRTASIGGGAKLKRQNTINLSKVNREEIFVHENEDVEDFYILNGEQILFYKKRLVEINGEIVPGELVTDVWTDISWTGIANEGNVKFKNGKKPEVLIKRVLDIFTEEGDFVLDSFAGSGTTAAVSHKMNRKWVTIEMGEHCYSHCLKRLIDVVNGTDKTGISKVVNWNGGGGFKFYELAPSLLNKDKFGNLVIDERYNQEMLAIAMCKQEGFEYSPDKDVFWKQGYSYEKDYIFVTSNFITPEYLDSLHDDMKGDESLLICCKTYHPSCIDKYENINIKKIPQELFGKFEYGKDNYNLNVMDANDIEDFFEDVDSDEGVLAYE